MAHQMSPPPQPQQQPPPQQSQQQQQQQRPQYQQPLQQTGPHPPHGQHVQHAPSPMPASAPYSPYTNAPSPASGIALPPNKRQRLSPNPSSPQTNSYASTDAPHYHSTPYPNTPYPPPTYNPYSPIAAPSPPPFNAPQPYAASSQAGGAMGPPPRPNPEKPEKEEKDKIHDISDVTDVFHGSGIDLREEENYMSNTFRNTHATNSYNASFASSSTVPSPNNSFGYLNQGSFGNHAAFSASGSLSQPPASQEEIEKELDRKHAAAARELAINRQQHLKDSFLVSNRIRHRMHQIAYEQGVALNVEGLYDKIEQPRVGQTMTDSDGQGLVSIKEKNGRMLEKPKDGYLQETAPLADILTLVSVAANQRLRTMLDDSYRLARGRRYGTHGIVPPDLADIATGENPQPTTTDQNIIHDSTWDGSRKRASDGNVKNHVASPVPTVSFSESLSKHLINLAIQDRDAEKERVRKRQERARRAAAANTNNEDGIVPAPIDAPTSSNVATPTSAPTTMPDTATQVAPDKPLTKKERERQAKAGQTEEVLHKNANTTAAMQLGMGKKGKKKYSWMSGGAPAVPSNPYKAAPKPATSPMMNGASSGKSPASVAESGVDRALQVRERKWGGWREDGIEGRGIQIRDWVMVLERDGREKKALQKALLGLDRESASPAPTPAQSGPSDHPSQPGQ
ncbi:hypothetical protein BDV97DRAFT_356081 [Delphinella strobiligena]|nr:hypothetical protein BDV97DRAFT_356081 [Delphinella strobiligena]